ncbi:MAG: ABC transporter ATP-binding protein [Lentilactobacillus diolivorans]|uniref:ABC transporter ATP-binding protein n=1 Tax=Lentilactobacillus diolivorans TaxID=179838 RepID=UPI0039EC0511
MIKLIRSRISYLAVLGAVLFLVLQVMSDLYLPTVTSNIIDKGIAQNNISYIWQEGFKMILVSFLGVAAAGGNIFFAATQSMKMGQKIRDDMFDKVTHFSEADMNRFGAASLDTRTTNDVVQIQNVMVQILRMMLMAPFMLIGASTMAFVKSPRLTIIFLITLPVIALIVGVLMYYVVPLFKVLQKKTDRINLIFGETLTGVRTIRSFNQDHYENRRFDAANKDFSNTGIRAFTIVSFIIPIVTIVFSFINVAIIWFGGQMVSNQSLAVGNLVAFMTYSGQILFSFMMLSMIFVFLPRASASATRINEVLSVKDTITDPAIPVDFPVQQSGTLSFEHVYFRYSNAEQQTLQDINFSAHAGQTVAIIGGTGSGKSTLINLIPRLFDPESGVVKINGVPVNQLTQHDLHEQISINQQQAILFAGTIRENMHYAKPDASDDEIWYALTIAQATEFITTENGGLDYHVEQNGDNFSGGQKQRLAIARTILKPAEIYIFDDSFSALDFETDAKLRMALKNDPQIKKAITVIVAQRISTVADADLIIVLDDCKISGIGSHKELAASNAVYQEILSSQIGQGGNE